MKETQPVDHFDVRAIDEGHALSFSGVDQDAQDATEVANFVHGIHEPANEARIGQRRIPLSAKVSVSFFIGAYVLAIPLIDFLMPTGGTTKTWPLFVILPIVLSMIVGLEYIVKRLRTKPDRRDEHFTLVFRGGRFSYKTLSSKECVFDVRDIIAFEAGRRITLVRGDGTRVALPCVLRASKHEAIVARLNELLAETKHARVDYRGTPLAVAMSDVVENDADESAAKKKL